MLVDAGLTPREREVFWLVAERLRNREIAGELHIGERTVETHVASLLRKLGGGDRTDLVALGTALREGLGATPPLPRVLSSFVGREAELVELASLLAAHRLVTLTGPAGVGKTRLALEVAGQAADLPVPVLLDLTTVTSGDELDRAFASSLGLAEAERGLRASLRAALAHDRHWLVVDNCEHLLADVARLLADLLTAGPGLRVLATSQSPLHVAGEVVHEVAPLAPPRDSGDPQEVLASPSARLFADRAASASPGFRITSETARSVAALCRSLDGLPLAIELAAARIRTFSPQELEARLDQRFQLLAGGRLDGPDRHRTLDTALQWSLELLDDDERVLFRRASVFPGEFDYDTAEAVLAFAPLDADRFARAFPRLLDRSLLSARRLADQTTSYRMLESFRAFGLRELAAAGGTSEVQRRHAEHHLGLAVTWAHQLRGHDQSNAVRWFERRWVDLSASVRWAIAQGRPGDVWAFLTAPGRRWDAAGLRGELFDWVEDLLDEPWPEGELGVRARTSAAHLMLYADAALAVRLAAEAHDLAEGEAPAVRAAVELTLGWALGYVGDRDSAVVHLRAAADAFGELGDEWNRAHALQGLGHVSEDLDGMTEHLEGSAAIFDRLEDHDHHANALTMLAARTLEMGGPGERVEHILGHARRVARRAGNTHEQLHAELHAARLAQRRGQHAEAAVAFRELQPALRRRGDHRCACRCLSGLGWAALELGERSTARDHLVATVEMAHQVADPRELTVALRLLARLEHLEGRPVVAARLLGAADTAADRLDPARRDGLPADDVLRVEIATAIGTEQMSTALREGREIAPTQLAVTGR